MRITNSMYYNNLQMNNNRVNTKLFDVNKQISSGLKIQYAYENTDIFVKTMELDDEITTFNHVKKSVENGLKFSSQTDSTIGEISKTLDAFKVKLIQAASDGHSDASLEAIAKELKGIRNTMLSLANTSINGQFLFSGTAVNAKPVNSDGSYNGNDESLSALLGNDLYQAYNISGQQLLFGEESQVQRKISTNVPHLNMTELYPDIMQSDTIPREAGEEKYITASNPIRDLVGDIHSQEDIDNGAETYATTYFYIRGTKHDGTAFKEKISMTGDESIDVLLQNIADAYKVNPSDPEVVNVRLNEHGQIEIEDKLEASSKLDFHMVAATDFSGGVDANITDIDDLETHGSSNFDEILANFDFTAASPTVINLAQPYVYIQEFVKSGLTSATGVTAMESLVYDRTFFEQNGSTLTSNVPQVIRSDSNIIDSVTGEELGNRFADDMTRLAAVASGTVYDPDTDTFTGMNGKQLILDVTPISGPPTVRVQIDFGASSTFSFDGGVTNYNIYNTGVDPKQPINSGNPQAAVDGNEMTYRQLMDVINMVVTGGNSISLTLDNVVDPITGLADGYNTAVGAANALGQTSLTHDGRIQFKENGVTQTQASISIYDSQADNFDTTDPNYRPSIMTFNTNNALTISDPKTDFFARIDEAIAAVEQQKMRADSERGDPRNGGIQNAIRMLDDLMDHFSRQQATSGVQSQSLSSARDRTEVLIVSSISLRSEVLDTDVAEASMRLQQLSLNMQSLYSATAKISQLSLVNYL